MTDSQEAQGANPADAAQQQILLHNLYLKDVSFESPNAPAIFREQSAPQIQMNIGLRTENLEGTTFEVELSVTVTAKSGDKTAFLVEVKQAGIFTLNGFPKEQVPALLGIYCPTQLFPYAREAVSSLVNRGGFPPLLPEPINSEALYAQHVQQQAQAAGQKAN